VAELTPQQILRKAISDNASPEEIGRLVEENKQAINEMPREEAFLLLQELTNLGPEYESAIQQAGDLNIGFPPILGGLGGAGRVAKGTAQVTVGGETKTVVLSPQGQNLLSKVVRAVSGGSASSFAKRVIGAGIGVSVISKVFEDGEQSQQQQQQQPQQPPPPSGVRNPFATNPELKTLMSSPTTEPGQTQTRSGSNLGDTSGVVDPGFNVMVVDHDGSLTGTPGALAVVSSKDMDVGNEDLARAAEIVAPGGSNLIALATDFLRQTGQNTTGDRNIFQAIFPESLGQVSFGTPVQLPPQAGEGAPLPVVAPTRPVPPDFMPGFPQKVREDEWIASQNNQTGGVQTNTNVPAGAKIAPRIFNQYNGRTLMEWASLSAQRHGIPLSVLYGIVDHESGWLQTAVGDNGNSFGLAQIFLPAWPSITQGQALNPVFALEWTAQKLKERFAQFGRWDAAVAAHNSPQAAQHLAQTGSFFNDKSANYVKSVLGRANDSGLDSYLFDPTGGGAPITGSGPSFTPFQTPDPAQSREYIRQIYEEMLGREPTDLELSTGVDKLNGLARQAYDANLRQAKGSESDAVDVGARFEETIRESGEFAFHEDVTEQRNFTDYAAGVARLLQTGA